MPLGVGLVPNCPDDPEREAERTERGDPRAAASEGVSISGGGVEEEDEGDGVEEEEENEEGCDFFADGIDLGFFEGEPVED